jgi:RNA polymerase sigma-70 factor (ECF subfamily)
MTFVPVAQQDLLDAARDGSEDAFGRIVEDHRPGLHAHCYRMLGSVHDAEDALQEALLRAWRGLPQFAGRSSLRTWLYRIATNACLDALARRPKRVLPIDFGPSSPSDPTQDAGEPLAESLWIGPYPDHLIPSGDGLAGPEGRYDQREAVEVAFIAALQHLPATQRAVLILRDVLGFSAREVAQSLETTVVSVNSALQRARRTLEERLPDRTQQATLRSLGDERARGLVEAYIDAWARADVGALRALLVEDAVLSMPPWPLWWRGADTIAGFAASAKSSCPPSRAVPIRANGQLAIASYGLDASTGRYTASAIDLLTLDGSRIKEVTAFVTPAIFGDFGLADTLAA